MPTPNDCPTPSELVGALTTLLLNLDKAAKEIATYFEKRAQFVDANIDLYHQHVGDAHTADADAKNKMLKFLLLKLAPWHPDTERLMLDLPGDVIDVTEFEALEKDLIAKIKPPPPPPTPITP